MAKVNSLPQMAPFTTVNFEMDKNMVKVTKFYQTAQSMRAISTKI